MPPINRQQNIDDGSTSWGHPANDRAQVDCHRRATPQARTYSADVIGLAQKLFPIAQPRKKALKTIAQESHRRACLGLDKASA
jgi:hypothetical protein